MRYVRHDLVSLWIFYPHYIVLEVITALCYQIIQSIAFACVVYFTSSLPTIPFSVYQTFVLEEKHGFNNTTPSVFILDLIKGWILGFVIGSPFLAGFLYVFKWAGDRFVPWLMGFMSVL
jgi:STE24 endopeptidase